MGGLLLLEEQDRSLWDRERIQLGAKWLERAASGELFSRFHAEAGIAAEHCFAPSFGETRWKEIADLYAMFESVAPSPLNTLNRAIAVAEWQGAEVGLALLDGLAPPTWLAGSYLWDAVLGDLHRRAGNAEPSRHHRDRALCLGAHGGRPEAPRAPLSRLEPATQVPRSKRALSRARSFPFAQRIATAINGPATFENPLGSPRFRSVIFVRFVPWGSQV